MKYLIRLLACSAVLAALSVPALPQEPTQTPAATQTQEEIDAARFALYGKFYGLQQKEPAAAYEVAKEYLAKYPTPQDQYQDAIKKFVVKYETEQRYKQLYDALKAGRFDDAFTVGKQVVIDRPDNLQINYDLARAGLAAATLPTPNTKNNVEATVYAKKTLDLVNAGKTIKVSKDQILSDVYLVLSETAPTKGEEITYRIKAAQTKVLSKDPENYFNLALAYQENEHTKATEAYAAVSKTGKPDDPEVKAALKTLQEASDRLLDALARASVYSTTPDDVAKFKTPGLALLTSLYKFRNKTDVGLQAFINGITARPLPEPGQPIDYFPPPAPVATTTPGDGMTTPPANGTTTPANGTATPAPAAGTTKPAAAKKPAPKARKPKKG